jgi:hypothetical protein
MRVALALIAAVGCGTSAPAPRAPTGPALALTWPALDGGTVELARFRGQVVVIQAFTTWSLTDPLATDALGVADARPDVVVIGLALDAEGFVLVSPWRKGADVHYLIALADEPTRAGTSALGRIREVPTTFVLDRAGRVAERVDRALSATELDAAIARAAREP